MLTYLFLPSPGNPEIGMNELGKFPYLCHPALCDGCGLCVSECPTWALQLQPDPCN